MGKKPTSTFGSMVFGKDGSVWPDFQTLPPDKLLQEEEIGKRLKRYGGSILPPNATIRPLAERDNDLLIEVGGKPFAAVELTEIRAHEYLHELTQDQYDNGSYPRVMQLGRKHYAIDTAKIASLIFERAMLKIEKNYAKPRGLQFWLVVWSEHAELFSSVFRAGAFHVSPAIAHARDGIARSGAGPFDKVVFFGGQLRPEILWPTPYGDPEAPVPQVLHEGPTQTVTIRRR